MLAANLRGRMFELEDVRTWERSPQHYADIIASSLAAQALFTHAPAPERARRALSKLRQTPRVIQSARDNIKDPPGIFVKVGIEAMRGALKFIDEDLPRAFSSVDDLHLLGDLADAQAEASQAVGSYVEYLETDLAPRARSSFRLGRDKFEKKIKLEEGIHAAGRSPARHRRTRAQGHAGSVQSGRGPDERRRSAADMVAREGRSIPSAGELVTVGRQQLEELRTYLERQSIVSLPAGEADHGGADAGFLSLVVRQHVDARPVREQADARLLLPH